MFLIAIQLHHICIYNVVCRLFSNIIQSSFRFAVISVRAFKTYTRMYYIVYTIIYDFFCCSFVINHFI